MKEMRRVLALVLCFVMLVGVLPVGAFAAEAETAEEQLIEIGSVSKAAADANDDVDFLFVATDRHEDTAIIGQLIDAMEDAAQDQLDYLVLGGGMVACEEDSAAYDSSAILAEVTAAADYMTAAKVDIVASAYDKNVNDDAGIVLPYEGGSAEIYEGERYYVYGVEDSSISVNFEAEAQKFEAWAAAADSAKAIIVVAHQALHTGAAGAYAWHEALNNVATDDNGNVVRDVIFFHGQSNSGDSAERVYDVGDHMVIGGGEDTIYYTYATAGYLCQNGTATLVTIDEGSITLEKFTTGGYETMTELERAEEVPAPSEAEPVLTGIKVVDNKTQYVIGDALDITVYAVYSDGSEVALEAGAYEVKGFDSSKVGTMSVFVTWGDYTNAIMVTVAETAGVPVLQDIRVTYNKDLLLGEELELTVAAVYSDGTETPLAPADYTVTGNNKDAAGTQGIIVTYGEMSFGFDVTVWIEDPSTGAGVAGEGVTGVTITDKTGDETVAAALEGLLYEGFRAYDIVPENYTNGTEAKVSLPIPEGVTNPAVYYVSEDGETVTKMNAVREDGKMVFTTDHFSTYVVGANTKIEVPNPVPGTGNGTITETVTKIAYKRVSNIAAGGEYLIANSNTASNTTCYLLARNGTAIAATGVIIKSGDVDGDGASDVYIELDDVADELWTVSNGYKFKNGDYFLRYSNGTLGMSSNGTNWTYGNNRLYYVEEGWWDTTNYYLRYNNGWEVTSSSNATGRNIYFYERVEYEAEEEKDVSGTYSIQGNPAYVKQVKSEGGIITLSSKLNFDYVGGHQEEIDPQGVTYEVVTNGDPNGVISGINGNVVTLSGNVGKALVKVSHDVELNDGTTVTVTNYITVDAVEPYYTMQIHQYVPILDDSGLPTEEYEVGPEITAPVALKNVSDQTTYDLWAVIKYHDDKSGEAGADIDTLEDRIRWTVSDPEIASVDAGILMFTGEKFGTFQVTAQYMAEDGETILCEDTIIVSATDSPYVVEGDGTDDFPEYPMEGAIRINKTADAVGNFSETGMAKVELSMTGVPYSKGNEIDVVIMIDMSDSMKNNNVGRVKPAREAAVNALETIVTNEDGSINQNRVAIYTFNGYDANTENGVQVYANAVHEVLPMGTYTKTSLETAKTSITNWIQNNNTDQGTNYGAALEKCYSVLNAAREEYPERRQFVIFVTDGEPTTGFAYVNDNDGVSDDGYDSRYNNGAADKYYTYTEYYSTQMKKAGVEVYTVGIQLTNSNAQTILEKIAGNKEGNAFDGEPEADYEDYAQFIDANESADKLVEIFENIVNAIKEAATDVRVVDKVGSNYTMTFKLPDNVTAEKADGMTEFYIQVVEYTLDADKERTGDPVVKEKFTFSASTGALISHVNDKGADCVSDCPHVQFTGTTVTGINGDYFQYAVNGKEEIVTWQEEKISTTELALQYFAYLDKSAGYTAADQVAAGSYYTNDYAHVSYINFQGTECQKEFPRPQMTWNGAQVTYLFYLVNEQGNPVNRAGREIPFANAVFVTDPVTEKITWYSNDGREDILAHDLLALAKVPEVYELYDNEASYVIRVYETEGVDKGEAGVNWNYFQIDGSETIGNKNTTIVYNNKAAVDARYSEYGVYSKEPEGTKLATTDENGKETTVTVTDSIQNIDFANTTVAFAVVWKPELQPDTVVVDYGLDVVINVITNDSMIAGVKGVMLEAPDAGYTGSYDVSVGVPSVTSEDGTWTASWETLEAVRFTQNNMQLKDAAQFYYEAGVTYYDSYSEIKQTNMYSSVTVIPATTVYYEDTFLSLTSYTGGVQDTPSKWELQKDGTVAAEKQEVDRPGFTNISAAYDGNNEYGNDNAYDSYSTYSLGSAQKITVTEDTYGVATFSFYGTGFDVTSLTSNTSGTLTVKVKDENNKTVKNMIVDTYYGYQYTQWYTTYTYTEEGWTEVSSTQTNPGKAVEKLPETPTVGQTVVVAEKKWTVTENQQNALYQIPVIKISNLDYAKYQVVITAAYNTIFDHAKTGSYDVYLDAIRIYDPTGVVSGVENKTVSDAYLKDGEAYPVYQELRNLILSAEDAESEKIKWTGAIFIDHLAGTYSITDYENYGPNNELYLASGQAIAFDLVVPANVADVQIGMKSADGSNVVANLSLYDVATGEKIANSDAEIVEATSATDRYYSIKKYVPADTSGNKTYTISFQNKGTGILSITNIKFTHTSAPASNNISIGITKNSANTVLKLMNEGAETAAPEVAMDAELEVSVRNNRVKVGNNISVKATTSADVAYLMVNGQKVTKYSENKNSGERSWSVNIKATEVGAFGIEVTAYSAEGEILETATETVEVTAKNGTVKEIVGQLIGMLGR